MIGFIKGFLLLLIDVTVKSVRRPWITFSSIVRRQDCCGRYTFLSFDDYIDESEFIKKHSFELERIFGWLIKRSDKWDCYVYFELCERQEMGLLLRIRYFYRVQDFLFFSFKVFILDDNSILVEFIDHKECK